MPKTSQIHRSVKVMTAKRKRQSVRKIFFLAVKMAKELHSVTSVHRQFSINLCCVQLIHGLGVRFLSLCLED